MASLRRSGGRTGTRTRGVEQVVTAQSAFGPSPARSSPEPPEVTGLSEPLRPSGTVAVAPSDPPEYVTKADLFQALASLETRITGLFAPKKRNRSPSPLPPNDERDWADEGEELTTEGLAALRRVFSDTEESEPEEIPGTSASHNQKLLIPALTRKVRAAFGVPPLQDPVDAYSSLGSLKSPQTEQVFVLHPLLEKVIYADWGHPDRTFFPPKRFAVFYPMEEALIRKWKVPVVDAAVTSLNRALTCPVDNAQGLRDSTDKRLESLLRTSFALAGAAIQPAIAAIGVCQALKNQAERPRGEEQPKEDDLDVPQALCFAVDALKDSIQQISRLALVSIHMRRMLWLKSWSAEFPCKRLLAGFPFHGERLFGEDLDKYIKGISGGKSVLLPAKGAAKRSSFKGPSTRSSGSLGPGQSRRPRKTGTRGSQQSQVQRKPWTQKAKSVSKSSA